jgi:DDE superfamily endonuclease
VWRHLKKLAENLALLAWYAVTVLGLQGQVRYFCEDETRVGLKITAKGVKPQGKVPWQFKATYLYGSVEPATGDHFFYEFTHLNSECFQVFLDLVSEQYKDCILFIQLAQAGAHKAKRLKLPHNIILLFQPSHAPETNPLERVWQPFKLGRRWQLPKDLDELRLLMRARLETMTQAVIASIVGWRSILDALSVAGL